MENIEQSQQNVDSNKQQISAQMREGGNASVDLGAKESAPSVSGEGVPPPAPNTSPAQSLATGKAISVFEMVNPFGGAAKIEVLQSTNEMKAAASSLPPAASEPRAGGDGVVINRSEDVPFSKQSATALAKSIGDKISTFKIDVWIGENIGGAAILEVVT